MREFYDGKSVRLTILMLFTVSLVGISGGLVLYFDSLDRLAQENLKERVHVALRVEANQQNQFLEEYSYWDESYEKTILNPDEEWIKGNSGEYLINKLGLEFTMAVHNGKPTYIATAEGTGGIDYEQLNASGLGSLFEKSRTSPSPFRIVTGYLMYEGELYLMSLGPFIDETTSLPRPQDDFLVFGQKMDTVEFEKIGNEFMLSGLRFVRDLKKGRINLPIEGEKEVLGYLVWNQFRPSREVLPRLVVIIVLFYTLFLAACWYILRKEARNIKAEEEKLYFMATKDYLTGVNNRRHVMELGQRMLSTHIRYGRSLSVLLLDIDHFKSVNDRYGHDVGDMVLNQFAKIALSKLRLSDIFGRFGGEEFIVVLHDTEYRQALEIADRIRESVYASGQNSGGEYPAVTVSIGVASNCDSSEFDEIIKNADDALYRAKNEGRNRVVCHDCGC